MKLVASIGFSLDDAEKVRRIVGKKKVEEMKEWEVKILDKIKEQNLPIELGSMLWKILDDSKDYSFNRSHAVCYASLAALTVYLKFKYPLNFFLALLKMVQEEPNPIEEISRIQPELRFFGIDILPPNLLCGSNEFSIEGRSIRFGVSSIKGITGEGLLKLAQFKHANSNKFELFQSAEQAKVNIAILSTLIQAGCLDGNYPGVSRPKLVLEAQLWRLLTPREKLLCLAVAKESLSFDLLQLVLDLSKRLNEKGKPELKESRLATIRRDFEPYKQIYHKNAKNKQLANWFYEKLLLGFSYSETLIDIFKPFYPDLIKIEDVQHLEDNDTLLIVGYVSETKEWISRGKKNKCFKACVQDNGAIAEALIFNTGDRDRIGDVRYANNGQLPSAGSIVVIKGRKWGTGISVDTIGIQDYKIYMRLSQLKLVAEELK